MSQPGGETRHTYSHGSLFAYRWARAQLEWVLIRPANRPSAPVPALTLRTDAIVRQLSPERRNSTRRAKSKTTGGAPIGLPLFVPTARARSSPALTRSAARTGFCLAIHARIANTASLNGPILLRNSSLKLHH